MNLPALHVLADQYRVDLARLADMDIDPQTLADTLEGLSGELEVKAQNVAMFCQNLEAAADAIKAHREHQMAREDAIRKRAKHLRDYLARCMQATGIERIEGPGIVLSFRKSTAVVIDAADLLPAQFMRQPEPPAPAPDKNAIAAALKAGQDVAGAHLETRQNLQIK